MNKHHQAMMTPLVQDIKALLHQARNSVYQTINTTMTQTYWEIGRRIVEEEQNGATRAQYGTALIQNLSHELTAEFGKGFSEDNLANMRRFYLCFQHRSMTQTASAQLNSIEQTPERDISETASRNLPAQIIPSQLTQQAFTLSWSHYIFLTRIDNPNERGFYEIEATENRWTLRELKRQFDSGLFERLSLSSDKAKIKQLANQGQIIERAQDLIKEPYILEFIGLPIQSHYSESDLEQKLIDKLEHFLLELGKGFTFVARQKRITIDEQHFAVDLVFYNRLLRCFVVIDLKIGELKHQDLGQMMMYVNYFDRVEKTTEEHPTIGIILCKNKSQALVEMTLPKDQPQIYASQYLTVLPNKEELQKLLESEDD